MLWRSVAGLRVPIRPVCSGVGALAFRRRPRPGVCALAFHLGSPFVSLGRAWVLWRFVSALSLPFPRSSASPRPDIRPRRSSSGVILRRARGDHPPAHPRRSSSGAGSSSGIILCDHPPAHHCGSSSGTILWDHPLGSSSCGIILWDHHPLGSSFGIILRDHPRAGEWGGSIIPEDGAGRPYTPPHLTAKIQ